jgi:hypothetical protein
MGAKVRSFRFKAFSVWCCHEIILEPGSMVCASARFWCWLMMRFKNMLPSSFFSAHHMLVVIKGGAADV